MQSITQFFKMPQIIENLMNVIGMTQDYRQQPKYFGTTAVPISTIKTRDGALTVVKPESNFLQDSKF